MDRATGAILLCCALAVAAGLWTIGGPLQARAERRDAQRLYDLRTLAYHLACLRQHGQPAEGQDPRCPEPRSHLDPFTGAPYRIDQGADGMIRVCSEFETDRRQFALLPRGEFDADTGCLTHWADTPAPATDAPAP